MLLFSFILLVTAVFVLIVRKGIQTKRRLCGGVLAIMGLCILVIGLHLFLEGGTSLVEAKKISFPLQEIGLGVLFLVLAYVGCMCADQKE